MSGKPPPSPNLFSHRDIPVPTSPAPTGDAAVSHPVFSSADSPSATDEEGRSPGPPAT